MRFQTNEAVAVQDPEMVLRALETCLRDVSSEVVRYGDKITLHGLGPSPKAMNYQDTTVLSVSAEDDKTIINADVSFQASAILGDVQQDEVVRSKLEHVFDQMRMQIDLESRAAAAGLTTAGSTMASSSSPLPDGPMSEDPPLVAPTASISPMPLASLETSEEPASENSPLVAPAASISSMPLAPLETTEEPAEHLEAPAPVPLRAPQEAEEHWDEDAPDALVAMLRRDIQTEEEELEHSRRWIWLVAAIVALFLVAGGVYLLRFRNQTAASRSAATVSAPTASAPAAPAQPVTAPASPDAGERTVTKIDAATIGRPPASPDSSALPAPKVATADPAVWLEGWAAAMRSRDPVAQASFYADPVNQYIDRRNVNHAALVQAKKADIGRRHGDWTFSANNVVVESRTPSEATIQLVKHYMVKTGPSQVSEIFVKTRLHLKSVDGQWKIASEEEIHSPAVASVNPIDQ